MTQNLAWKIDDQLSRFDCVTLTIAEWNTVLEALRRPAPGNSPAKCQCLACDTDGPHASSCAVHNGTALAIGPRDCRVSTLPNGERGSAAK